MMSGIPSGFIPSSTKLFASCVDVIFAVGSVLVSLMSRHFVIETNGFSALILGNAPSMLMATKLMGSAAEKSSS